MHHCILLYRLSLTATVPTIANCDMYILVTLALFLASSLMKHVQTLCNLVYTYTVHNPWCPDVWPPQIHKNCIIKFRMDLEQNEMCQCRNNGASEA